MKKSIILIVILIVLIGSFGCRQTKNTISEKPLIGVVISNLNNPFFIDLVEGVKIKSRALDYELIIMDSGNSVEAEYKNVEGLIASNIDMLIINPTDSDSVFNSIKLANDSDIPVITIDRSSNGGQVLSHIASDNESGGEAAAEYIIKSLDASGKVAELQGIAGTSAAIERGNGFRRIIQSASDILIVASERADFNRDKGEAVMRSIIEIHPDLDAVFAHNDEMALGAIAAIDEMKKDILVVGFDGTADGVAAVEDGKMALTIAQQPEIMGLRSIEVAEQYLKGKDIDPVIMIELKVIMKE